MKYYIANFGQLKQMHENCIPISTAVWNPKFWKYSVDKNNVFLGICEKELSPYKIDVEDEVLCSKDCKHRSELPNCAFLSRYRAFLDTIDINYILSEFERVAEDVRKITHYIGEPNIVLLVYEKIDNPCSERQPLIDWFKHYNIELINWENR